MIQFHRMTAVLGALLLVAVAFPSAVHAANGLVLEAGGQTVVHVWDGVVTGEIEVHHEEFSDTLNITWLDDDSTSITGIGADSNFTFTVADTLVSLTPTGPFSFVVEGLHEGISGITLTLQDISGAPVPEYTSPNIEVHVEEEHQEADGLIITGPGGTLVHVWQGVVTGEIDVHHEETTDTLCITYLDEDSLLFFPEDVMEFATHVVLADSAELSVDRIGDSCFTLTSIGSEGVTGIQVGIFHDGHYDFLSPVIPVDIAVSVAVDEAEDIIRQFRFSRPWPNPSTGAATLQFALPTQTEVSVNLYDIAGRKVRTFYQGAKAAGAHTLHIDAGDVSPGVYFVRLATPEKQETRKLTLTR